MIFSLRNQPKLIHIDIPIYTGDIGIMSLHMQAKLRHIQLIYCVICEPGGTLGGSRGHNNLQLTLTHSLTHTLSTAAAAAAAAAAAESALLLRIALLQIVLLLLLPENTQT
jgi:hypothetical protein